MTLHDCRQAERRAASGAAIARHYILCDRRQAERRRTLSAMQGNWTHRYDAAKC
jgi:hypothetical protein